MDNQINSEQKTRKSRRFSSWDSPRLRPVPYDGPNPKLSRDTGRDILTLYLVCKLGYSPIRHVIGLKNDKLIEDVIRQHRLGRSISKKEDAWRECRLRCPSSTQLDEISTKIIINIANKYGTIDEDYVHKMLTTGKWEDDPVTSEYNNCPKCGLELSPEDYFCRRCGIRVRDTRQLKLTKEAV